MTIFFFLMGAALACVGCVIVGLAFAVAADWKDNNRARSTAAMVWLLMTALFAVMVGIAVETVMRCWKAGVC